MAMVIKRGNLPDPTWENLVMFHFPKEVQWSVTMYPEGFLAEVRGIAAPQIFEDWTHGLEWVARQFGISETQLHDLKSNVPGKRTTN